MDGDREPAAHVRVETGLDAWFAARHPELRAVRLGPVFDDLSIGFLDAAYRDVHGDAAVERQVLLRSHRTAARRAAQGLAITSLVARLAPGGVNAGWEGARRADTSGPLWRRSKTFAYLLPIPPSTWLAEATQDVVAGFVPAYVEALEDGLSRVGNPNLDTGRPEEEDPGHGGHLRTRAFLGLPRPLRALRP